MRSQGRPARAAAILAVLALVALGCSRSGETPKPRRRAPHKVFLIGFDGMDPTLARRWMAEGKLPNLSQLAREGAFSPLQTTQPSESPTAWASFATGVNPGKHNIFDFLVRDYWSRTRAYALGLGQIYFNLRGRESRGIVSAGAEYAALQDEIVGKISP